MKRGTAIEGFIREDGTIRPIEHYDDTELRGKIQTNTDNISNLNSRVTELEEHGGVEDHTKADKVVGATAGNIASLDEDGNLQDSGKKPADFALAGHSHSAIIDASTESSISIDEGIISIEIEREGSGGETEINADNIGNLHRALATPSTTPEDSANKLITSKAVYDALAGKAGIYNGTLRVDSSGDNSYPIPEGGVVQTALDSFVESAEKDKMYNVLVQFATQSSSNYYCPAIVYWEISSQDDTVVHIYVGDYHFMATKAEGGTAWESEEFDRYKISTFLETF